MKFRVNKGTELAGEFNKLPNWMAKNLLFNEWDSGCICWMYITILDEICHRYMEDYGYKYYH